MPDNNPGLGFCTSCGLALPYATGSCPRCGAPTQRPETHHPAASGPSGRTVSRATLRTQDTRSTPESEPPDSISSPATPRHATATASPAPPSAQSSIPLPAVPSHIPQGDGRLVTQPAAALVETCTAPSTGQHPGGTSFAPVGESSSLLSAAAAGLGTRLAANLIDSIVLSAAFFAVYIVLIALTATAGAVSQTLADVFGLVTSLIFFALLAGSVAYYALSIGRLGQTIGKRTLGVMVIDVTSGMPIGAGAALGRYFLFVLMGLPFYLGYLTFFTDGSGQNRAFHDRVSNDRVVRVLPVSFGQSVRDVIAATRGG